MKKTLKKNAPKEVIKPFEEQLKEIMECFDFDRIHEFMSWEKASRVYDENENGEFVVTDKNQWRIWNGVDFRVPTSYELKQDAAKMLTEVWDRAMKGNNNYYYTTSGPFKASYVNGMLVLECVIEYWYCDY